MPLTDRGFFVFTIMLGLDGVMIPAICGICGGRTLAARAFEEAPQRPQASEGHIPD